MDEQKISTVWPDWKAVRLIGKGSYGCVYEVERCRFERVEKAAVKLLTIPQDRSVIDEMYGDGYDDASISKRMDDELQSMVKEYYLMADLKGHTNVVDCDDLQYVKHPDGLGYDVFIRMELLTPLNKVTREELDAEDLEAMALKLGKDICRALELCEQKNIVHRDIKPQNILLSEFGDYKLGDFGIAKTMEHTTSGTKTGTYKYMSPEVYNGRPYGHSADIYSLGLVMYWLLNESRLPFLPLPPTVPTASMEDRSRAKRFGGEPLPEPMNGGTALKKVVLRACAYEPKERFASATEMLRALKVLEAGESIETPQIKGNTTAMVDTENITKGEGLETDKAAAIDMVKAGTNVTDRAMWDDATETIGISSGRKELIDYKEDLEQTKGEKKKFPISDEISFTKAGTSSPPNNQKRQENESIKGGKRKTGHKLWVTILVVICLGSGLVLFAYNSFYTNEKGLAGTYADGSKYGDISEQTQTESEIEIKRDVVYTSQDRSIQITLPDNTWEQHDELDTDGSWIFVSEDSAASIMIMHDVNPVPGVYVAESKEELRQKLSEQYGDADAFKIIEFEKISSAAIDTYEYVVKYNEVNGRKYNEANGRAYDITYGIIADMEMYVVMGRIYEANMLDAVKTSIESFTVLDNSAFNTTSDNNNEINTKTDYGTGITLYTTTKVNLRAQPDTASESMAVLEEGSSVTAIGETQNWYVVSVNGTTGYISKAYLTY